MSIYKDYLNQIENRKKQGLHPQPIDGADLLSEIVSQIKDIDHRYRAESLDFFIYNVLPGTTSAASVKAKFLKEIILGKSLVKEITVSFAFEQLSHMKGGPSIEVLLDVALGNDATIAMQAGTVLKTQVFLYEADMNRLEVALKEGNETAKSIIESYAKAEFFTKLPKIDEEIEIVTLSRR
jgi:aconitate hydratase 2/2-methylisocitrate dehydratase